mgnify:CR=1 FL=1
MSVASYARTSRIGQIPFAHYQVTYQPDKRHLQTATNPQICETPHQSAQLPLWTLGADEWLHVLKLPGYAPRRAPRPTAVQQPPLFTLTDAG